MGEVKLYVLLYKHIIEALLNVCVTSVSKRIYIYNVKRLTQYMFK